MFNKLNFKDATDKLLTKTEGDWWRVWEWWRRLYCSVKYNLALTIQHRAVLLLINYLLVGAESWQRGATKTAMYDAKKQELMRLIDDMQPYT